MNFGKDGALLRLYPKFLQAHRNTMRKPFLEAIKNAIEQGIK